MDDSGTGYVILPEGLFVVTGCGHAGVVNTLEYPKEKSRAGSTLYGVIGGFHLKEIDLQSKGDYQIS